DNIHGETGLDGPVFEPLTRQAENTHAVKYIIDTLMASDGDITLVPVGPLSNIAVAMRMQPAILPKIREIVLMGGAYGPGNFRSDNMHGETGLDGPVFEPLTRQAENTHAVKYIIDTLMASDGDITLVPVGPLSNIAVAMRMQPAILPKIREIVLMGGAYGTGNF